MQYIRVDKACDNVADQDLPSIRKMNLISYGLGNSFDPSMFDAVKNRDHIKPIGGLWASPVGSKCGWKEWCEREDFARDFSQSFEFEYVGNILVIDEMYDLLKIMWRDIDGWRCLPDYEAMRASGIDAIYLTARGQEKCMDDVVYKLGRVRL